MIKQRLILIQGDARRIPLADGSVHCVITSPPYWSLRDYGLKPSVWGGEELCQHEWGQWREKHDVREESTSGKTRTTERFYGDPSRKFNGNHEKHTAGAFCQKCGAWFGCLGLEPTPELYVEHVVLIFREVRRVLRDDGTLWLNIGDSYASGKGSCNNHGGGETSLEGHAKLKEAGAYKLHRGNKSDLEVSGLKPKDLVGIPWMLAFALRADGWYLRQEIIWAKPNPMPESVTDRCTKAHEQVFLLTKSPRYFYDADAIREPVTSTGGASFGPQTKIKVPNGWDTSKGSGGHGSFHKDGRGETEYREITPQDDGHVRVNNIEVQSRKLESADQRNHPLGRNKRSVWQIATQSFPEAHFATYPIKLVNPCIQAGTSEKGCCPKCGAPWKRVVERIPWHNGNANGIEYAGKNGDTDPNAAGRRMLLNMKRNREAGAPHNDPGPPRITVAWIPSCKCPVADPVPCTVLDPFNGAATTGVAAKLLDRSYIGIEPKAEYIEISRKRLANTRHGKPKVTRRRREKPEPSLFALETP
jgi:DNA modification methylase